MEIYSEGTFLKGILVDLADLMDQLVIPYSSTSNVGIKLANQVYYRLRLSDKKIKNIELADYGKLILGIVDMLGGKFDISSIGSDRITFATKRCVFGTKPSPTLCKITSGVFGGLSMRYYGYGKVVLAKTIATGASSCEITVFTKQSEASDRLQGLEYTNQLLAVRGTRTDSETTRQHEFVKDQVIGVCGSLVNSAISTAKISTILSSFTNGLAEIPGVDMIAMYLKGINDDAYALKAFFGLDQSSANELSTIDAIEPLEGETAKQHIDRQVQLIAGFNGDRDLIAQEHGLNGFAAIPLVRGKSLVGVLNIATKKHEPIGAELSNLMRELSNILVIILDNYDLRNRVATGFETAASDLRWIQAKLDEYDKRGEDSTAIMMRLLLDKIGLRSNDLERLHLDLSKSA